MSGLMQPATADTVSLVAAIANRFEDLKDAYLRIRGVTLQPPEDIRKLILSFRGVYARFKRGDLRHTLDELKSIRNFAQWTLDVNAELRGQRVAKITWVD